MMVDFFFDYLERLLPDILALANRYGVEAVYLYGSLLTGKLHPNSDIDIMFFAPDSEYKRIHAGMLWEDCTDYSDPINPEINIKVASRGWYEKEPKDGVSRCFRENFMTRKLLIAKKKGEHYAVYQ